MSRNMSACLSFWGKTIPDTMPTFAAKATGTVTAGGGSNDNDGATPDAKGRGAEVIGVDGTTRTGCGKDAIAAAAINRQCSQGWPPLPPLMTNNDHWLLAVVVINCAAAAMMVGGGGNSGCHQGQDNGEVAARRRQGNRYAKAIGYSASAGKVD